MNGPKLSLMIDGSIPSDASVKSRVFFALVDLVQEKPFDKITVKELCERAGVAKSTFYTHFVDKHAVMQWHYDLAAEAGINKIGRSLTWEEGHLITTTAIAAALPLYQSVNTSYDFNNVLQRGNRRRQEIMVETLRHYRKVSITDRLMFQISALIAGEQAAVKEYLVNNELSTVERVAAYLVSIVPPELHSALQLSSR